MSNDEKVKNVPSESLEGWLIFDEMPIQPDLQFLKREKEIKLIGPVIE